MEKKKENEKANQLLLRELERGDLVEFPRGVYSHWGVYLGNSLIAHLAGDDNDGINANVKVEHMFTISGVKFDKARVCIEDFWKVVEDCVARKGNTNDKRTKPLPVDDIIRNATSKLGEVGYSLMYSNCEHFAKWCRYGISKSDQVDSVLTGVGVGFAAALTGAVVYALAKFGGTTAKEDEEEEAQQKS